MTMQNDVSRQWAFLVPIVSGSELTAQAQGVEALGMAGIFVPEIYSSPFMGLGYCAALTDRVQLASGISNAFASSPFEIAMTAMDLDRVSDGRLVLGLGTSIKAWTEGFYGMPYGKPVAAHARGHRGDPHGRRQEPHRRARPLRRRPSHPRLVDVHGRLRSAAAHRDPDLAGRQPDRRSRGWPASCARGSSTTRSTGRSGCSPVDATPWPRASPRPVATLGHPLEQLAVGGGQQRSDRGAQRCTGDGRVLRRDDPVRADVRGDGLRNRGAGVLRRTWAAATWAGGSGRSPTRWPRRS